MYQKFLSLEIVSKRLEFFTGQLDATKKSFDEYKGYLVKYRMDSSPKATNDNEIYNKQDFKIENSKKFDLDKLLESTMKNLEQNLNSNNFNFGITEDFNISPSF